MDAAGRYPVPDPLWRREPPAEFDCGPRSNVNCKPVPHATGSRCRTARGGGAGPCFLRRGALAPAAAVRRAARRSAACQSGRCCQSTALWFHGTVSTALWLAASLGARCPYRHRAGQPGPTLRMRSNAQPGLLDRPPAAREAGSTRPVVRGDRSRSDGLLSCGQALTSAR